MDDEDLDNDFTVKAENLACPANMEGFTIRRVSPPYRSNGSALYIKDCDAVSSSRSWLQANASLKSNTASSESIVRANIWRGVTVAPSVKRLDGGLSAAPVRSGPRTLQRVAR
jgi:hypothetical protein